MTATPLSPPACPPPPKPPHIPPEGRDARGRIKPGFGGRARGSKNKASREAVAAVQELAPKAIESLKVLLAQHNFAAVKYVLDTTLPRDGRPIDLDATTNPHDLMEAVTSGEISPSEFARISQGFKTALDAVELKELKSQVDELELLIAALRK